MKVIELFQEPFFRISVYGILTCFTLLDDAEWVECTLNISILVLEMVFLIHQDIVSSDAALGGFPNVFSIFSKTWF